MIVLCENCKRKYDDAEQWTICPHNSLDVAADTPYCRRHDLYNCHLCADGPIYTPPRQEAQKPEILRHEINRHEIKSKRTQP